MINVAHPRCIAPGCDNDAVALRRKRATPAASAWIHPVEGEPETQVPKDERLLIMYTDREVQVEETILAYFECIALMNAKIKCFARLDLTGAEASEDD